MRPHNVLDDMLALERMMSQKQLGEAVNATLWDVNKKSLAESVTFDFGELAPTPEHEEFGFELVKRGLFTPPFPITFYSGRALGINHGAMIETATHGDDGMYFLTVVCETRSELGSFITPMHGCAFYQEGDFETRPLRTTSMFKNAVSVRRSTGEPYTDDQKYAALGRALRFVIGATSMLMSKDVQKTTEHAPVKLNAQRARKGRSPINDVHTIKIVASEEHRYLEAGRLFGTHASPKMHWRRGHFRTLHRGEDNQKIIPVAPSLVGANESARGIVPKEYAVR